MSNETEQKTNDPGWLHQLGRPNPAHILELKAKHYAKQLKRVSDLLDEAGVPEIVDLVDAPHCSADWCRLKWYLARRKDVQPWERDEGPTVEVSRHGEPNED